LVLGVSWWRAFEAAARQTPPPLICAAQSVLPMWRVWGWRGGCIGSWWGNRKERDHWGDLGVDGWIILRWISRRWDVKCGLDWVGPG